MSEHETDTRVRRVRGAPLLLTTKEVADIFRVRPRTVNDWVRTGRIQQVKKTRGKHLFREEDVLSLFTDGAVL